MVHPPLVLLFSPPSEPSHRQSQESPLDVSRRAVSLRPGPGTSGATSHGLDAAVHALGARRVPPVVHVVVADVGADGGQHAAQVGLLARVPQVGRLQSALRPRLSARRWQGVPVGSCR